MANGYGCQWMRQWQRSDQVHKREFWRVCFPGAHSEILWVSGPNPEKRWVWLEKGEEVAVIDLEEARVESLISLLNNQW
ncbi:hypothetical protein NC653_022323 [Populus alba x Populus x berolinensis]|uniref:Uncharacterized protein n=1 Tax=Populus alba x Populus x berolinensis TaxID=444605 RepID=A0AAD6MEK6_9ROSI|nr:hypothetical protein NC653_022323 [Populus alba x Populus x berolinensis]